MGSMFPSPFLSLCGVVLLALGIHLLCVWARVEVRGWPWALMVRLLHCVV